ncbi:hypothetical protein BDF20DRAFT_950217 [Mycotypha africana]|uniref:uncharacterized protein n=1 Tax=Mycotypha africana TaxID=64632 RepID=UPI0023007E5A|nr:uncharacterized protein BDF20DRAFT_950217 [Mycotypha africana]KAI8991410.1 hypothetical protein BDF20DRAFT_950217 [Mycotypha africana]
MPIAETYCVIHMYRVALRVRPLTQKEHQTNCTECITFIPNEPQILIGRDHSFTYDYVFDNKTSQRFVYDTSVVPLVEKFVDGFNSTILAYGQTGSGKTFSMGTASNETIETEQQGIVPRFIQDLFNRLQDKKQSGKLHDYKVYVSFLELYNEDFVDLLSAAAAATYCQQQQQHNRKRSSSFGTTMMSSMPASCDVQIREDVHGQIYWTGVREELCSGPEDLLWYLTSGSQCRTTGSTDMNSVSSRSHAIFSVILKQDFIDSTPEDISAEIDQSSPDIAANLATSQGNTDNIRTIISKFHFVDLAGSERLKRTKAEGNRAREGISINSGLLALGNVISALGDDSRKQPLHIPYRDSKLTRLLQDSLGGNSQTLMLACVSPSDSNFLETLSTLKYANRARNIKNKITVNEEYSGSSAEINQLRSQVAKLKLELKILRTTVAEQPAIIGSSNNEAADMIINNLICHSNGGAGSTTVAVKALKEEIKRLKDRIQSMSDDICRLSTERDTLLMEKELSKHLVDGIQPDIALQQLHNNSSKSGANINSLPIISQYQTTIKELRNELADTQERLAFSESIRASLAQAIKTPAATPNSSVRSQYLQQHHNRHQAVKKRLPSITNNKRSAGVNSSKKRRTATINGSTTTTTSKNVTFRSARRSKVPNTKSSRNNSNDDIDSWLNETLGSLQTTESISLRADAKLSIDNAKTQIEKALQVLDEFKDDKKQNENDVQYNCDILHDNELFEKLQSEDFNSLFDDFNEVEQSVQSDYVRKDGSACASSQDSETQPSANEQELTAIYSKHPQFKNVLNQLQSDIQMNEELVRQLEKTETEYCHMRRQFEKKLHSLREEILALRQQKEKEQQQKLSPVLAQPYNSNRRNSATIRLAYEAKMKQLMGQLSDLRRKYNQTSSTIQTSRNKNETMLRSLRSNVESLKIEKSRMIKRMKEDAERVKEKLRNHEREIQQLQRKQAKDNEIKRRLEREVKQMQIMISKKNDESIVASEKLNSLVRILKKAVREGGILDEESLANCGALLNIGSALLHSFRVGRISHSRRQFSSKSRKQEQHQRIPAEIRATKKKALLDNALCQFIQGTQAVEEMKQLLAKRNDLSQRKIEYLSEREMLVYDLDDSKELTTIDQAFRRVIDENIERIEAEISYVNARIHAIRNDAAAEVLQEDDQVDGNEEVVVDLTSNDADRVLIGAPEKRKVTFADQSEIVIGGNSSKKRDTKANSNEVDGWFDIDTMDEKYSLPTNAGPEQSLKMISEILMSITEDEASLLMEAVIDDMVALRMEEYNNKTTIQQLERTSQDLRRTLIVMKKAAIDTTIDTEKKFKQLLQNQHTGSGGSRRTSLSSAVSKATTGRTSSNIEDGSSGSDVDSAIDLQHHDDNISYQHVEDMFEKIYNDGINGKIVDYNDVIPILCPEATISSSVFAINAEPEAIITPYLKPLQSAYGNVQQQQQQQQQLRTPLQAPPLKPSASPLVTQRRNSMSSPEQFLRQVLQTPMGMRPPPPSSPLIKPTESAKFQRERETSINSSARSSYRKCGGAPPSLPRRTSVQSDNGSSWCVSSISSSMSGVVGSSSRSMLRTSSGSRIQQHEIGSAQATLNRRRAHSFQLQQQATSHVAPSSPPTMLRRSSLLREMSNIASNNSPVSTTYSPATELPLLPRSATAQQYYNTNQYASATQQQQQQVLQRRRSLLTINMASNASSTINSRPTNKAAKRYSLQHPEMLNSSSSSDFRKTIVVGTHQQLHNVFDRLSNGHTHASQAKQRSTSSMNNPYRFSMSSIDDLRKQWSAEVPTSAESH